MTDLLIAALVNVFSWPVFGLLVLGTTFGIIVGIIPGISGYFLLAVLIPFVFGMDPLPALALLLGGHSVCDIGGAITACLFNVPGTGQNIATMFDGYPIAQRGEGGRAVAAALVSSAIGAVIGALIFIAMLPVVRPLILVLGSGDFFMLVVLGIVCIGWVLGEDPIKGLMMGCFGIFLSMIGQDPTAGTIRFSFEQMYLWDGINIVPVVIGLIAVSEMWNMAVRGGSIAQYPKEGYSVGRDMFKGIIDTLKNWWLVVWCSLLGFIVGFIPGLGGQAASFIAYGVAVKGAKDPGSFGKGNIQGVIAPETANSSKEGGALLPTLAFGVPGSGGMAVLLGTLIMLGIVPGQAMFKTHLTLTVTLGFIIAIGNIVGTIIAFFAVRPLIKLTFARASFLVCPVLMFAITGSYATNYSLGDLVTVYIFAVIGFFMKKYGYPSPPLVLGFVLGRLAELNLNIALAAYGWTFMFQRLITLVLTILVVLFALSPLIKKFFRRRESAPDKPKIKMASRGSLIFSFLMLVLSLVLFVEALSFPMQSRVFPMVGGIIPLFIFSLAQIVVELKRSYKANTVDYKEKESSRIEWEKTAIVFFWMIGFFALVVVLGFVAAIPVFTFLFLKFYWREKWHIALIVALLSMAIIYGLYIMVFNIPLYKGIF